MTRLGTRKVGVRQRDVVESTRRERALEKEVRALKKVNQEQEWELASLRLELKLWRSGVEREVRDGARGGDRTDDDA